MIQTGIIFFGRVTSAVMVTNWGFLGTDWGKLGNFGDWLIVRLLDFVVNVQ